MKELRPPAPADTIRILFAFDPRRTAILLIGGDKRYQWTGWYEKMIPVADDLYLSTLRDYVEALGGRLEIRAVFPDRVVDLAVPATERQKDDERLQGLR